MKRRVTIAFPPIQSNHNPYKCGLSGSASTSPSSAYHHQHHHHSHHHHYTSAGCSSGNCCTTFGSNGGGGGCGGGGSGSSGSGGHQSTAQCDFNGNIHAVGGANGCCGTANVANDDWRIYAFIAIIAVGCYLNGIHGEFVHDDIPAITMNKDVLGVTRVIHVFRNDFWGTPMSDASSHKSYRPLTTLSFR